MSRQRIEAAPRGSALSKIATPRLLTTAYSCAHRTQLALEGLGSASSVLVLSGMAAGVIASFISGAAVESGHGLELP